MRKAPSVEDFVAQFGYQRFKCSERQVVRAGINGVYPLGSEVYGCRLEVGKVAVG